MIIDFRGNTGGGGGSGTTNYNELSNKPQINNITLSGNVSSDQLGITPNELKAVENVPSAATNGSVFSEYREDEVKYGWQYDSATGTAFTFDISLNPYSGVSEFTICYFNYNGSSYQATLQYYEGEDQKTFVFPGYFYVGKGEIKENQGFWDSDLHVTVDYSDITKIVLTFDNDVEISNEIAPASSIQVTKELKQAYNQTESVTTEWAFWGGQTWQGKAENTEFRMPTNFIMPSGETLVSNLTYYDIPINTYWDGTQFKVEYSLDSGTTWQWAFSATTFGGSDGPVTVGPSEGQGKTCELSYSWYYYGDVDKNCFKLSSNKSLSHPVVNNFTNEYNVVYFDTFLKSGSSYNLLTEKPQINGVELVGNKTSADLGISGGTSNYNELENKPQINGVTLSGNKTSQDLGITSESLEPVSSVPSGASVGDVYAVSKSQTVGYGWEEITNGYAFNCSLNPASGDSVEIGQLVGNGDSTNVAIYPSGYIICFGDGTNIGFTRRAEFDGGYVNINYYDYNRVEFTFEGIDVPTLQNAISSVSKTIVENKAVQVEAADVPLAHWEFWTQYQGRYQDIQFWLEQNGQKDFLPNTELGLFSYYQLYFKLYTNADGFFCVDYSNDSAVTWNHYIQNANIPVSEPEYYPIDITDPNGKQALFKAWFRSGDGNFGVIIKSNKYLWLDNYVTPNGVLTKDLLKEGYSYESLSELPQINGVELKGNMSTSNLNISLGMLDGNSGLDLLQIEQYSPDGSNISGKTAYIINWDGQSDIDFQAEAYYNKSWGSATAVTPYYSGSTWYGVADWRNHGHTFELLPGNRVYIACVDDASKWKFDGNYSGQTELTYISSIKQEPASTLAVSKWYKNNALKKVGVYISEPTESGTLTVSASTNDVITADYDYNQYRITGATFNGDPMQYDSEQNVYIATLSDGLTDVRVIHECVSLVDAGTINSSKHASVTDVGRTGMAPGFCSLSYIEYPVERDFNTYQFNGYTWDKLVKDYELPAAGPKNHWFNFEANTYNHIRMDVLPLDPGEQYKDLLWGIGAPVDSDPDWCFVFGGCHVADGNIDYVSGYGNNAYQLGTNDYMCSNVQKNIAVTWHIWMEDGKLHLESNMPICAPAAYGGVTNVEGCVFY